VIVFDTMVLHGQDISHRPFLDRYHEMCTYLRGVKITGDMQLVPKRMYTLDTLGQLTAGWQRADRHTFQVPWVDAVHPDWTAEGPSLPADGLIWMDGRETFGFLAPFGLLKWKRTNTVDVLMDLADLYKTTSDLVPTYYWEYEGRLGRSVRKVFGQCQITRPERLVLWQTRMSMHRKRWPPTTVCVECYRDGLHWQFQRGRFLKERSNSSRTLQDTLQIVEDALELGDLLIDPICVVGDSVGLVGEIGRNYQWLGRTWRQTPGVGELELRMTYEGQTSIPPVVFYRVVERLEGTIARLCETDTEDYGCGSMRTTRAEGVLVSTIRKETDYRVDFTLPEFEH
jgi:hypothetical protein